MNEEGMVVMQRNFVWRVVIIVYWRIMERKYMWLGGKKKIGRKRKE